MIDESKQLEVIQLCDKLLQSYPTFADVIAFKACALYNIPDDKVLEYAQKTYTKEQLEQCPAKYLIQKDSSQLFAKAFQLAQNQVTVAYQLYINNARRYDRRDYSTAVQGLREILKVPGYENNYDYQKDLAFFLMQNKSYDKAIKEQEKLLKICQRSNKLNVATNYLVYCGCFQNQQSVNIQLLEECFQLVLSDLQQHIQMKETGGHKDFKLDYLKVNYSALLKYKDDLLSRLQFNQDLEKKLQMYQNQLQDEQYLDKLSINYNIFDLLENNENHNEQLISSCKEILQFNPDDSKVLLKLFQIEKSIEPKQYMQQICTMDIIQCQVLYKLNQLNQQQVVQQYSKLNCGNCLEMLKQFIPNIENQNIEQIDDNTLLKKLYNFQQNNQLENFKCKELFTQNLELQEQVQQYEEQLNEYDSKRREVIKDKKWVKEEEIKYDLPEVPKMEKYGDFIEQNRVQLIEELLGISNYVKDQQALNVKQVLSYMDCRDRQLNNIYSRELAKQGYQLKALDTLHHFVAYNQKFLYQCDNEDNILFKELLFTNKKQNEENKQIDYDVLKLTVATQLLKMITNQMHYSIDQYVQSQSYYKYIQVVDCIVNIPHIVANKEINKFCLQNLEQLIQNCKHVSKEEFIKYREIYNQWFKEDTRGYTKEYIAPKQPDFFNEMVVQNTKPGEICLEENQSKCRNKSEFIFSLCLEKLMNQRQQQIVIYPDIEKCVKIDTFLILPTNRLIFGQMLIGGNCVYFKPHYKFQVKYEVIILFDDIQTIRILEQISFNENNTYKPGNYEVINSFALNMDKQDNNLNQYINLPSPQQQGKQTLKRLDTSLFNQYLQKTHAFEHNILNITTFDSSKFFFFSKCDLNALAQQEILIQGSQTSDIIQTVLQDQQDNKNACYVLEPPQDDQNLISDIQKNDQEGLYLKKRKVSIIQMPNQNKQDDKQIEMTSQQNNETVESPELFIKDFQSNDSKPSNILKFPFKKYTGNKNNDNDIQKMWKNKFQGKNVPDQYQKYNLLIKVKDNLYNKRMRDAFTKQLIQDALVYHNEKVNEKLQKLMFCLFKSVKNSKNPDDSQKYEEMPTSTSQTTTTSQQNQVIQQIIQLNQFSNQVDFIGRKSMIFDDNFIRFIITSFYSQKYIAFPLFTQYSACRDGQHLNNFYESYNQLIHDYIPDPEGVNRIDSLNYNIDRKSLQMLDENFVVIQLEKYYVILFLQQEVPKNCDQFGGIQTQFIIFSKELYLQIQQCLDLLSQKQDIQKDDPTFIKLQQYKDQIHQYRVDQNKIMKLSGSDTQYMDLSSFKICSKAHQYFSIASAIQINYNLLQLTFGNCDIFDFNKEDVQQNGQTTFKKIKDVEVFRFVLNYEKQRTQSYIRRIDFSNQE